MGMTAIDDADPKREDIMTLLNTFKVHTGTLQSRSRHYINDLNVLKIDRFITKEKFVLTVPWKEISLRERGIQSLRQLM